MKDDAFGVRNKARDVLATTNSPQAAIAIVGLLEDDRIGSKKALIQMGPVAESAVIVLLEHPDQFIQAGPQETGQRPEWYYRHVSRKGLLQNRVPPEAGRAKQTLAGFGARELTPAPAKLRSSP